MPELSLDVLSSKRPGVTIVSIEMRRLAKTEETVESNLPELLGGRVYGLTEIAPNAAYVNAQVDISEEEGTSEWLVAWDRMPDEDVPEYIAANRVGTRAELEGKLHEIWRLHDKSETKLQVTYVLDGYFTRLLAPASRRFDGMTAHLIGNMWRLEGEAVTIVSPIRREDPDGIGMMGFATFSIAGWPNVADLELRMWKDIAQVVTRGTKRGVKRKA